MGNPDKQCPDDQLTEWRGRFRSRQPLVTRVDLLGPPAAGKSTLCRTTFDLLDSGKKSDWVDLPVAKQMAVQHAFKHAIPKQTAWMRASELARMIRDTVLPNNTNRAVNLYSARALNLLQEQIMESFSESHHDFMEALAEQWHDPDTPLPTRLERFNQVHHWIKDLLFISCFVGDAKLLADNARLTKGMAELLSNPRISNAEQIVTQYCESPLAPTGIIHLSARSETVHQHSKQREKESGRINPGHRSRSLSEVARYTERKNEVNEHAIHFYQKSGIAVLNLTAETDMRINANQVVDFLKGL